MSFIAVRNILQRSALNCFNNVKKSTFMFSATRYNNVAPSSFQKKILVWTKFYPSIEQVPEQVSQTQMKKAHDLFRVKSSFIMVIVTFVALGVSMSSGFFLRKQGDSVTQRGLDRIESWKKE